MFTTSPRSRLLVTAGLFAPLAVAAVAISGPPIDLTGWTLFDPDNDWAVSNPVPTAVRLDEQVSSPSVHPGWAISDFTLAATCTIEFDLMVTAGTLDDDFIGFGFSFVSAANSYLLDWKRQTQTFNWGQAVLINDDVAEQGLKIKRIDGGYTWDGLWGGTDGMGVSTIAGPTGGGWAPGTTYHFVIELAPGQIKVTRDGMPIFDVSDPSYLGGTGSIAAYGFSQDNIVLSNVCITPTPTTCPADLTNDGVVNGADLGVLLGSWGTRDIGDLDNSGSIDGSDLGLLLGAWGPCP